jgi:PhnB protein
MKGYKPADRQTIVPRLFTRDVEGLVAFIKGAFGAKGRLLPDRPTELVIGDCVVMVAYGGGVRKPTSSAFYISVPDADKAWARAVKAGAKSFHPPEDTPWGDRRAIVNDAWGNHWQIATHGGAKRS